MTYYSLSARKLSRKEFNLNNVKPFCFCIAKNLDDICLPINLKGISKFINFDTEVNCTSPVEAAGSYGLGKVRVLVTSMHPLSGGGGVRGLS